MRDIKTRRAVLKTARVIGRRRRIFKGSLVTVLGFVFCGLLLYLCNASFLRITKVVVVGNNNSEASALEQIMKEQIAGRYAFIVPRDNILFYPQASLTRLIRQSDPALATANISLNSERELVLKVAERSADFLWCNTIDEKNKHCYFMDKNGVAFMEAPQFSDNVFIEIVGRTKDDPLGKTTVAKDEFQSLYQFVRIIPTLIKDTNLAGYSIYRIVSLGGGDYNIFFHRNVADSGQNWYIIVNLRDQATNVLAGFSTIVESEIFKKDVASAAQGLDYIDLRFGKKIFYKFK
jgi:hypothetical protein